jgi:hypothetical protein
VDGDGYDALDVGGEDCDDGNADAFPGNPEVDDDVDNDCNGLVDDGIWIPFQVVLAGNFLGDGNCSSVSTTGCDLYRAEFEGETWDIVEVERLTSVDDEGEIFPSIDRSGAFVAFESALRPTHTLCFLDLESLATRAYASGRYPSFANRSDLLTYSDNDWRIHLASYAETGSLPSVLADHELADGRDPEFFPDDGTLIFHHRPEGEETRTVLLDLETGVQEDWSAADGCAHATVNDAGTLALCQEGTIIKARAWDGSDWGSYGEILRPSEPSDYGEDMVECTEVWFSYPQFCGGDDIVALSANCVISGAITRTKVILVDLGTGEMIDLHGLVEEALGLDDRSSVTITCTSRG